MKKTLKIDHRLALTHEILQDVFRTPRTIRVSKFDEESLEDFQRDFNLAIHTEQPVIPILIDSYGGEGYALKGMIATIEQSPVPVATICSSKAISCGAILFAFGSEGYRYLHPEATLMIHDASWWTDGKVEDIKADAKIMDHHNKRLFRRMAKHLGHPPDYILDLIKAHNHVDWYLTAKEAKRHNIANHLRIPTFEIEIGVNIQFG